jgi:replicative DNA helicase
MTNLSGDALFAPLVTAVEGGGEPPVMWSANDPVFDHIKIGPGRIGLVAGAPGSGKTALFGQQTMGMLLANPDLRVLMANVEMPADALMLRQLSRLSGVPLTDLWERRVHPCDVVRLRKALEVIRSVVDRLMVAGDPHSLGAIATAASDFGADLLCLDYVQRIDPSGDANGMREKINLLMSELRRLANKGGVGILAAVAVSRARDSKGKATYDGRHLSMASLRESGELEFGADDVFILHPTDDASNSPIRSMLLKHEKSRYGQTTDVALTFHRQTQRFEIDPFLVSPSARPASAMPSNDGVHSWRK